MSKNTNTIIEYQVFNIITSGIKQFEGGPEQHLFVKAIEDKFGSETEAENWVYEKGRTWESYTIMKVFKKE